LNLNGAPGAIVGGARAQVGHPVLRGDLAADLVNDPGEIGIPLQKVELTVRLQRQIS
jgi:hypothetical protein